MTAAKFAVVSLLLNVVLTFGVWRASRPPRLVEDAGSSAESSTVVGVNVRIQTNLTRLEVTFTNELPPFHWEQVQSDELTDYVANLRGTGCPEETIRDIIRGELVEQFLARRRVLLEPWQRRYWDLAVHGLGETKKLVKAEIGKLEEQTVNRLDEILGSPAKDSSENEKKWHPDARWSYLPEAKQREIAALNDKFELVEAALPAEKGRRSPERTAKLKEIQQQRESAIQSLLTPEELAEHKLRTSRHAYVGRGLTGFDATPEEMRTLTRVYDQFSAASESVNRKDPDYQAKDAARKEAQRQRDEALKAQFDPERYADLKRAQDGGFQEIFRVAERYDLPRETAVQVDDLRRISQEHARKLSANRALSDEQRAELLRAIQDETRAAIRQSFGEQAARTYERNGGEWLRKGQ